jgi:hypothetical protein
VPNVQRVSGSREMKSRPSLRSSPRISGLSRRLTTVLRTELAHVRSTRRADRQFWVSILSCMVALGGVAIAWRALDYAQRIRAIDEERDRYVSARTRRDALLRMKLLMYAEYARGSMKTLRDLTYPLISKQNPGQVLSGRTEYSLFKSYIYDAQLGIAVGNYCVGEMFAPTSEDLSQVYRLENEFWRLQWNEFAMLDAVGIPAVAISDSLVADASHSAELKGPYMAVMPLPRTTLAMPLQEALKQGKDKPRGTYLQASGADVYKNARFRFFSPIDGKLLPSSEGPTKQKWFLGRFRVGMGMAIEAFDLYGWVWTDTLVSERLDRDRR